jgi:hypothetical protein
MDHPGWYLGTWEDFATAAAELAAGAGKARDSTQIRRLRIHIQEKKNHALRSHSALLFQWFSHVQNPPEIRISRT